MGKKGSWFAAIKRVFSSSSKEKLPNASEKKNAKEKKKKRGTLKHGDSISFIPMFREPSSIEKILGEADQQKLFISAPTSSELPKYPPSILTGSTSPRATSPKLSSPRAVSSRVVSPRDAPKSVSPKSSSQRFISPRTPAAEIASPRPASPVIAQYNREAKKAFRAEPTLRNQHLSATRIQTAYRGYMARRSLRALKALVRLQEVVRGQNVKRQTLNAMNKMQLLVRIQTQIQLQRIQNLDNQTLQSQSNRDVREVENQALSQLSEAGDNENWDDSLLTKDEVEEKLRKKAEALVKRERALAYSYSNQLLWKTNQRSAEKALDFQSNGFSWWRNWLEYQQLGSNSSEISAAAAKSDRLTPQRPMSEHKPSPWIQASNYRLQSHAFDNNESVTPRSSKSSIPVRAKQLQTLTRASSRTPPPNRLHPMKYTRPRSSAGGSLFDVPMNDTDSLTSCPPLSTPNYMIPTASAMAKARPQSNPKERSISGGTPRNESNRRFSFPLTPNMGSFKWSSRGSNKDFTSQKGVGKHQSTASIGEVSIDSAISMPAAMGKKPFNRFV